MKVYNTHYNVFTDKDSKLKYVFIGDLHGWINNEQIHKVIKNILEIKPDVIMIAGDILNSSKAWHDKEKIKELREFFSFLSSSGIDVVTVLGNHDTHSINDELLERYLSLETDKVHPLYNSSVDLEINDEKVHIAGLVTDSKDGVTAYTNRFAKKNGVDQRPGRIVKTLEPLLDIDKKDTNILLMHDCRQLRMNEVEDATSCFDVRLSAHIHNGYLPFEKTLKDKKYLDQDWRHYLYFGILPLKSGNFARGTIYGNGSRYVLCTQSNDYYYVYYNKNIQDIEYVEIPQSLALEIIKEYNLKPSIITGGVNRYVGLPIEGSEVTSFTLKKRL